MRRSTPRRCLVAAALVVGVAACGSQGADAGAPGDGSTAGGRAGSGGAISGSVTVLAAASLTDAFREIAEDLERTHPDLDVVLNLGGSSGLAQQVLSGAPADVVATASRATMATVTEAGDAADPEVFARNALQIAVPAGNPGGVSGLEDFADEDLALALCAEQVPCGAAAAAVLGAAGVRAAPDTLERDVKAALSKVRLGEVDAALVYRTDVLAAGDEVEGIAVPDADASANDYLIATLSDGPNPAAAAAFRAAVLSEHGQQVLSRAGFARP